MSFNFMVAIRVHSDAGAQENKSVTVSFFPHLFAISDGGKMELSIVVIHTVTGFYVVSEAEMNVISGIPLLSL